MKNNKIGREVTIKGIITPTDWDDEGNVTAVAVSTPSEDEYLVDGGKPREQLLELIGAEVVVSGTLGLEKKGSKTIMVNNYELLGDELEEEEESSDEEYPEDEDIEEEDEEW